MEHRVQRGHNTPRYSSLTYGRKSLALTLQQEGGRVSHAEGQGNASSPESWAGGGGRRSPCLTQAQREVEPLAP